MKIYLIRHGQTTGDIEDRFGGDYEDHLTEEGERQAVQLGEKLMSKGIEIIFCSPRVRAQETAELVNQKLNTEVKITKDVRERNHYGVMTGMTKEEAKEKYPDQVGLLHDTKNTIKGGEDYESFGKRIKKSLDEILDSNYQTIGVLTHGGPIRFIFREILKLGEIKIGDCAVAELDYDGKDLRVINLDGIELTQ